MTIRRDPTKVNWKYALGESIQDIFICWVILGIINFIWSPQWTYTYAVALLIGFPIINFGREFYRAGKAGR